MDGEQLKAWRKMVGISQPQAAKALGYGRRHYLNMESGLEEIRDCIPLACAAYALGIREYKETQLRDYLDSINYKKGNHNGTSSQDDWLYSLIRDALSHRGFTRSQ